MAGDPMRVPCPRFGALFPKPLAVDSPWLLNPLFGLGYSVRVALEEAMVKARRHPTKMTHRTVVVLDIFLYIGINDTV
jgi:hypothetical protein